MALRRWLITRKTSFQHTKQLEREISWSRKWGQIACVILHEWRKRSKSTITCTSCVTQYFHDVITNFNGLGKLTAKFSDVLSVLMAKTCVKSLDMSQQHQRQRFWLWETNFHPYWCKCCLCVAITRVPHVATQISLLVTSSDVGGVFEWLLHRELSGDSSTSHMAITQRPQWWKPDMKIAKI